jgi:hypothetical protein
MGDLRLEAGCDHRSEESRPLPNIDAICFSGWWPPMRDQLNVAILALSLAFVANAAMPLAASSDDFQRDAPTPLAVGILPHRMLMIDVSLALNLSTDQVGEPISLWPDVWYGAHDTLTGGVVHSSYGLDGFWGDPGGGLCLTGHRNGCPIVYGNVGVLFHYLAMRGGLQLALDAGPVLREFDPFVLALKVGGLARWRAGALVIGFDPNIQTGVTERSRSNQERVNLPVSILFTITPATSLFGQSGASFVWAETGDGYRIPVSLGATWRVTPSLSLAASFTLTALLATPRLGVVDGLDGRALMVSGRLDFDLAPTTYSSPR